MNRRGTQHSEWQRPATRWLLLGWLLMPAWLPAQQATTVTVKLGPPPLVTDQVEQSGGDPALQIDPPLSLDDTDFLLRRLIGLLNTNPGDRMTSPTRVALEQGIALAQGYIERLDKMHPTLPNYTWRRIMASKVPRKEWGALEMQLTPPLPGISALAFNANNSDVDIIKVIVVASDRTRWEFTQGLRLVAEMPRREIYFLPLTTELKSITVECRMANPEDRQWPRLFVEAGTSALPESAREANYHLQLARVEMVRGAAGNAMAQIRLALNLLKEYRQSRGL